MLLHVIFVCGPIRCNAPWLQGLPLGQYAAMIYKMIEQAAVTALVITAVATAPYGPMGTCGLPCSHASPL